MVRLCTPSRVERIQRGAVYRNMYLTADENGDPQIYNKTYAYLDNLSSYLYSPVELRFRLEKYGAETIADRAKFRAAATELHRQIRSANVDTMVEQAVLWALVKGKTFIKMSWNRDGFEPLLVQPEFMGVLEENVETLDRQEAFVHTTYVTPTRFQDMVEHLPNRSELLRKVAKYIGNSNNTDLSPTSNNMLRQVVIGGLNPYRAAGTQGSGSRGVVNWMVGPNPTFAPQLLAKFIPIDELWVRDSQRDDEYTTIQLVGNDVLLTQPTRHRNLFADAFDPENKERRTQPAEMNPLAGHHPFIEFCPNRLEGYFWGLSEMNLVGLLQASLNQRINGINLMLRMQEKPPRAFIGSNGITQQILSRLNKPDGYLTENNPNAKIQSLAPEIPRDLWESLHELEGMFDQVGGFAPVLQGRGESGVRAQGHAETLVRTASPRFKDRALAVERQVEELGGLCSDLLRAKWVKPIVAWVSPTGAQSVETIVPPTSQFDEPPVQGSKPIEFLFHQLPECKVTVDSHSSSPAFSMESRELAFALAKAGAVGPEQLVELTHPPHESSIITDIERREAQKAEMIRQHPELLLHEGGKRSHHAPGR